MIELLKYLRANGYRTYIVTGGGQDFVRVYSEEVYGIPPEQMVGTKYGYNKEAKPFLTKEMLVLHGDAKHEYAYGPALGVPDTKVGTFTETLYDEAKKKGWIVICECRQDSQ